MERKWTEEQKRKQSILVKERMNKPEILWKTGSANRGKKFSQERIEKMHGNRLFESYSHPHSKISKKLIGEKSKSKWTNEYKEKNREIRENNGKWIPLDKKSDYEIYFIQSSWIEKMFDRISENEEILLKEHGIFNAKKNNKGVVRDHIYSRKSGFIEGIFPQILRHPTNCLVILHAENVSKAHNKANNSDGKTKDQLFDDIENYTGNWKEQKLCLTLIKEYKNGKQWKR